MNRTAMYQVVLAAGTAAMFATGMTVSASEADARIESSFRKTYVYQTYLKTDDVKAEAKNGVVTLTGTVAEESHKTLAQDTLANMPGVTSVDNKLVTKAEAAAESADASIGKRINLALLFHRNVSYSRTTVEVKDGIVTLKGEAVNEAQKELTAEYAKDIDGVKEVKNQMTIAAAPEKAKRTAGEKLDDASITAQVRTALLIHRSTSSVKTKIVTLKGEVSLTGIARNEAEKSLITKLVGDIHGVTGVKNQMTIEEAKTE